MKTLYLQCTALAMYLLLSFFQLQQSHVLQNTQNSLSLLNLSDQALSQNQNHLSKQLLLLKQNLNLLKNDLASKTRLQLSQIASLTRKQILISSQYQNLRLKSQTQRKQIYRLHTKLEVKQEILQALLAQLHKERAKFQTEMSLVIQKASSFNGESSKERIHFSRIQTSPTQTTVYMDRWRETKKILLVHPKTEPQKLLFPSNENFQVASQQDEPVSRTYSKKR